MTKKQDERARLIRRSMKLVSQLEGVPVVEGDRLWLVSGFPPQPVDPSGLSESLLCPEIPDHRTLSAQLGAIQTVEVTTEVMVRWTRAVAVLEDSRDLEQHARAGRAELKRFSPKVIQERTRTARAALGRLGSILSSLPAVFEVCDAKEPSALGINTVLAALPARVYALGNWSVDPIQLLQAPDPSFDRAISSFASSESDTRLRALSAIILRLRQSSSGPLSAANTDLSQLSPLLAVFQSEMRGDAESLQIRTDEVLPDSWARTAERVGILFGPETGPASLKALLTSVQEEEEKAIRKAKKAIGRFRSFVKKAQGDSGQILTGGMAEALAHELGRVPGARGQRARALTRVFINWMENATGAPRPMGLRPLVRIALEGLGNDLTQTVDALGKAWLTRAFVRFEGVSERELSARLEIFLSIPQARLFVPGALTSGRARALQHVLRELDSEKVSGLWHAIAPLQEDRVRKVAGSLKALSVDHGIWALRLDLEFEAARLAEDPMAVSDYLGIAEVLSRQGGRPEVRSILRSEWFTSLFKARSASIPAVTLALITDSERQAPMDQLASSLLALAKGLELDGNLIGDVVQAWRTPRVEREPHELQILPEVLGVPREALEFYLHYRRLSGLEEGFSRELLAPLRILEKEDCEAEHLRGLLRDNCLSDDRREVLRDRLASLEDIEAREARSQKSKRRARNLLDRAVASLARRSLDAVLDSVYRKNLEELIGRPIPINRWNSGMRESLQLLRSDNRNLHLFIELVRDAVGERSLESRPPNLEWLERARSYGLKEDRWLAGIDCTVDIGGEPIRLTTERDPFEIIKMGSYFNTCLGFSPEGSNSSSTVMNALDLNKQVLYARNKTGGVVGRKLFGCSQRQKLLGYFTYSGLPESSLATEINSVVMTFAEECGLVLGDSGDPEKLHQGFWYDDGIEPWSKWEIPTLLPGVPQDESARQEWAFLRAMTEEDLWHHLEATSNSWKSRHYDALFLEAVRREPAGLANFFRNHCDVTWQFRPRLLRLALIQDGRDRSAWWMGLRRDSLLSAAYLSECILATDGHGIDDLVTAVLEPRSIRRWVSHDIPWTRPAGFIGRGSLPLLLSLAEMFMGVWEKAQEDDFRLGEKMKQKALRDELAAWGDIVEAAYLRELNSIPLQKALKVGSRWGTLVVVEVATRRRIPRLGPGLRRHLSSGKLPPTRIGLALGTQGHARDAPAILELLERDRESLDLALALVRCGDPEGLRKARDLWIPPHGKRFSRQMGSDFIGRVRELGGDAMAHRIQREAEKKWERESENRGAQANFEMSAEFIYGSEVAKSLALLGRIGTDVEPEFSGRFDPAKLYHLRDEVLKIPAALRGMDGSSEETAGHLEWWRELVCSNDGDLRDVRMERKILGLLSRPELEVKEAALAVLSETLSYAHARVVERVMDQALVILGEDRLQLSEEVRISVVRRFTSPLGTDNMNLERAFAWLAGCDASRQTLFFSHWLRGNHYLGHVEERMDEVFLAWKYGSKERKGTAEAFLSALPESVPTRLLLVALDRAYWMLTAGEADRWASDLLDECNLDQVDYLHVSQFLLDDFSYRCQKKVVECLVLRLPQERRAEITSSLRDATWSERASYILGLAREAEAGLEDKDVTLEDGPE